MHDLAQIARIAWADLAELLPWFFVAILIAAAVDLLCLDIVARRSFRRHGLIGILFTTSVGAFSPFCSFTVIPLIRKLLRGGVPLSAVMAFWIASPAMDPPIFAMTAAKIGVPLATARLLGALAMSVGGGLVVLFLERRGTFREILREEKGPPREQMEVPVTAPAAQLVPAMAGGTGGFAGGTVAESGATASAASAASPVRAASAAMVGVVERPACGAEPAAASTRGGDVAASTCGSEPAVSGAGSQPAVSGAGCEPGVATAGSCSAESACGAQPEADEDGTPWLQAARASLRSKRNWRLTVRNIRRDGIGLGKWLVFACIFEATIRVFVPTSLVTSVLGGRGILAIPLAVLISVPLYLNGVGAIPIVGGLLLKGMAPGAAVSFLLGGAVTTVPAMVAVYSVVNNRVFAIYLAIGMVGSTILGFIAQAALG